MTSYMLGIDIGTTSTKAVLFSENGDVVQKESIGYPLYTRTYQQLNKTRKRYFRQSSIQQRELQNSIPKNRSLSFRSAAPCTASLQSTKMTSR